MARVRYISFTAWWSSRTEVLFTALEQGLSTQNVHANYKLWQKVGEKLWEWWVFLISNLSVDKLLHMKIMF